MHNKKPSQITAVKCVNLTVQPTRLHLLFKCFVTLQQARRWLTGYSNIINDILLFPLPLYMIIDIIFSYFLNMLTTFHTLFLN